MFRSLVYIIVSGIPLGIYINAGRLDKFLAVNIPAGVALITAVWLIYSLTLAYLEDRDFREVLKKDAVSYLPLTGLFIVFVSRVFNFDLYHATFLNLTLYGILMTVSVSAVVFLKIYFLHMDISALEVSFSDKDNFKSISFPGHKLVWGMILIFTAYLYALLIFKFKAFSDNTWYMHNLIWDLSHGKFFYYGSDLDIRTHIFGTHLYFLSIPISWVYAIFRDIRTAVFLQSFLVSLGILPVFYLGRRLLKSDFAGFCLSIVYILHPVIQMGAQSLVLQPMILAPTLIMAALFFLYEGKEKYFLLFMFLLIISKEVFAILIAPLGIYIYFILKKRKTGLLCAIGGIVYFLAAVKIKNHLNMGVAVHKSYTDLLFSLLAHPPMLLKYFFDPKRIEVIIRMIVPLGFIILLRPLLLLVILPFVAVNFLDPGSYSLIGESSYRFAPLMPFFILGAILSVKSITKRIKSKNMLYAVLFFLLSSSVISFYFYNPFNYFRMYYPKGFKTTEHNKKVKEILKTIPETASVAVTPALRGILAKREEIYIFPRGPLSNDIIKKFGLPDYKYSRIRDVDYVVIDLNYPHGLKNGVADENVQWMLKNRDYGIVRYWDGLIVFKKGYDCNENKYNLCIEKKLPVIENKRDDVFYSKLQLLGFNLERDKAYIGKTVYLTLFWKVLDNPEEKYVVLVRFHRNGYKDIEIIHKPVRDIYPTSLWKKGDIIRDEIPIDLGGDFAILNKPYDINISLLKADSAEKKIGELYILPSF